MFQQDMHFAHQAPGGVMRSKSNTRLQRSRSESALTQLERKVSTIPFFLSMLFLVPVRQTSCVHGGTCLAIQVAHDISFCYKPPAAVIQPER
jgi:hypothetical protein